jgi:prepilin-type processing-associated H-X9-DG protein
VAKFGKSSLWEVLAIASIACVLAMILWPVTSDPYLSAQIERCRSNLKQAGTSMLIYLVDYDERLPDRDKWIDCLDPYAKTSDIFKCPGILKEQGVIDLPYSYSFNEKLSLSNAALIAHQDQEPMLYDSSSLWRNANDHLQSLPEPPRQHGKSRGNMIAFLDGHVKLLTKSHRITGRTTSAPLKQP